MTAKFQFVPEKENINECVMRFRNQVECKQNGNASWNSTIFFHVTLVNEYCVRFVNFLKFLQIYDGKSGSVHSCHKNSDESQTLPFLDFCMEFHSCFAHDKKAPKPIRILLSLLRSCLVLRFLFLGRSSRINKNFSNNNPCRHLR